MVLMPMTITFCRSCIRLIPLLAVLAVAASVVPMRKAMGATPDPLLVVKGAASELGKLPGSFDKKLHKVADDLGHARDVFEFAEDHLNDIEDKLQALTPGAGGNPPSGSRGNSPSAAVGYVVAIGNQKFSVSGIDIDSPVTRTGMCVVGVRAVPVLCGAQLCRQLYGGRPLLNCATGAELCPFGDPQASHFLLHQGKATLFLGLTRMSDLSLYACSPGGGPSTGGAVLGLGKTGTLARTFGTFSYVLSDRHADAVRLGVGKAQQGQGTPLIANLVYPDRYYVQITSILVGGLPLQIPPGALDIRKSDGTGGVYLSTTRPLGMILKAEVYELLKAALQNSLGAPDANSPWLCYYAGATKVPVLPTITLVFANNAVMALPPGGSVWYPRKDGAHCLTVLRSLTGETVLGTRVQMGRLMTYKLAADGVSGAVMF